LADPSQAADRASLPFSRVRRGGNAGGVPGS